MRRVERAARPRGRAAHRDLVRGGVGVGGRALVEAHRDVRTEHALDVHRGFGRQPVLGAVDVRAERDAVIVDLVDRGEREHLKAAGVGEDRAIPRREAVQTARRLDHLEARAQVQVVRVAEDDPRVDRRRAQPVGGHRLDRAGGADGHEHRRRDVAVRRVEDAGARVPARGEQLEREPGGR